MENKFELTFYYAGMFAGKSLQIVNKYNELLNYNQSVECFKHIKHQRYGSFIKSRAKEEFVSCTLVNDFDLILKSKAKNIIIDEIQFFDRSILEYGLQELSKTDKHIFIAGLRYQGMIGNPRNEWSNFQTVLKYTTEPIELKSKCDFKNELEGLCSALTDITAFTGDLSKDLTGQKDCFHPRCDKHYVWGNK